MDNLDKIVKAFHQVGADKQEISPDDLVGRTSLNKTTMKSNMKFLTALGILKAGEDKTHYLFEEKGGAYARALATGDDKTASAVLKELMINSYLKELIDFVDLNKSPGLTYEQLLQHIKGMARLKEDSKYGSIGGPYRTGISTLIDLLIRAGIVPQDIVATREVARVPSPIRKATRKTEGESSASTKITTSVKPSQGIEGNFPFTLNITVEAKDPESIKQLIGLIRELTGKAEQSGS